MIYKQYNYNLLQLLIFTRVFDIEYLLNKKFQIFFYMDIIW